MKNKIITFYSFKGGSGRSQLAANLAAYLCYYENKKILLIDWDLEAPGIDYFFKFDRSIITKGLIEVFEEYVYLASSGKKLDLSELPKLDHIYPISEEKEQNSLKKGGKGKIDFIPAANYNSEDYTHRINKFDWFEFYENLEGRYYIEFLKRELKKKDYDFIFIDSRTGISDYLGICNIQLPDVNIIVVAPSSQNLDGAYKIANKILEHSYTKANRINPIVLPVFSRIDIQYGNKYNEWIELFLNKFAEIVNSTLMITKGRFNGASNFIRNATINYEADLAYGETIKFSNDLDEIGPGSIQEKFIGIWRYITHSDSEREYNYFPDYSDNRIPPDLTLNLPKVADLTKIIGREQDLKQVRELLQGKQKVVVVNGLGGIGKTTVAQAYLTQYYSDYAHILWLTQSEGDNFMLDLITAPGLTLNLGIETSGKDAQTLFTEIIAQLKNISTEKPNLLVIDNANANLQRHFDYLPKPPQWHILATSREKMEHFFVKDLDFLTEDHAVLLFRQHCQRITDEAQIKSVLRTIDYHTLTIEILAKTAQRYDTALSTLQQAIERDLKAEVYIPHKGDKIEKVASYLLSIFDLAPLSAEELHILQHFVALPSEFIPYDLLKTLIPSHEENIAYDLQDLSDKGWLVYTNEPEAYKIHRIIQKVVHQKLRPTIADLHVLIDNVTSLLSVDDTKDNPVDKFPFIPYGEAALSVFPDASDAKISSLQNNLATVLKVLGDYAGAKALLEKALRSDEANFGENHPTTSVRYSNLATVLQVLGDYAGAKALLEKATRSDETNFGEDHPNTAVRYSNLATVLQALGDYAGAKALLEKALRSDEVNFGEDHPSTAVRYSNLALVLQDLGDYAGAKALLEKALRSAEANFGENHPSTAVSYSNLAIILKDLGDYTGAKVLLEKALRSAEANFGENHPTTAVRYSNLATVIQALGDYAGAKALLEKALRSDEVNFGENHPTTAVSYSNLALVLKDLGDYAGAKALLEKATHSIETNFGENHPNTASSYSNLATVYYQMKDYESALILISKAHRIYAGHLGEQHPNTKVIEGNIDVIASEMSKNGWMEEQIQELINL
jgi:tetratricopeptide (TPR) repeat protein